MKRPGRSSRRSNPNITSSISCCHRVVLWLVSPVWGLLHLRATRLGGVFLCAGLPLHFLGYVVAIVYGCGVCVWGIYFCMVLVKRVRASGIPVCFYILLSRGELCVVPPGVFLWVVWLWDGVRVRGQLRCLGHVD